MGPHTCHLFVHVQAPFLCVRLLFHLSGMLFRIMWLSLRLKSLLIYKFDRIFFNLISSSNPSLSNPLYPLPHSNFTNQWILIILSTTNMHRSQSYQKSTSQDLLSWLRQSSPSITKLTLTYISFQSIHSVNLPYLSSKSKKLHMGYD